MSRRTRHSPRLWYVPPLPGRVHACGDDAPTDECSSCDGTGVGYAGSRCGRCGGTGLGEQPERFDEPLEGCDA